MLSFRTVTCDGTFLWVDSLCRCVQLRVFLFRMQHTHLMTRPAYSDDRSCYGHRSGQLALQDVTDLLGAHRYGKFGWSIYERENSRVQARKIHFKHYQALSLKLNPDLQPVLCGGPRSQQGGCRSLLEVACPLPPQWAAQVCKPGFPQFSVPSAGAFV